MSRWFCTPVTGHMTITTPPWRGECTSTRPTQRTAMLQSPWRDWSRPTLARINVKWKRLRASAAGRCCWSLWVSQTSYWAHRAAELRFFPYFFFSAHRLNSPFSWNAQNHTTCALSGCFDVIRYKMQSITFPAAVTLCPLCDPVLCSL